MSVRNDIMAAITAALNASGKPADLKVHRERVRPLTRKSMPAAVVYLLEEQRMDGDGPNGHKDLRKCVVVVELRIAIQEDSEPDLELDPMVSWTVKTVCSDAAVDALVERVTELSVTWDAIEREGALYAAAAVQFQVTYTTAAGDPDTP